MTNPSSLELDIASLLCARLCHDLAGPVGAVNNGAELLNEGGAESMDDARELISSCAGQAVRRLRRERDIFKGRTLRGEHRDMRNTLS